MADEEELTKAQRDAREAIATSIREAEPVLGPGHFDEGELDPVPQGQCLLSEWVLVVSWIDEKGQSFLTKWTHQGALDHQVDGLLFQALNQM